MKDLTSGRDREQNNTPQYYEDSTRECTSTGKVIWSAHNRQGNQSEYCTGILVNSYGAIRYLGGALARYILRAPKYHKTRSIVYFGPLYLDN